MLRPATHTFSHVGSETPSLEHGTGSGRDAGQQPAVDARHRTDARPAAVVEQGEQLQPLVEPLPARTASKATSAATESAGPVSSGVGAEPGDVVGRQVDAPHLPVLDDVAQDVGELEGDAEGVGELRGPRPSVVPNTASDSRPIEPATRRQYATNAGKVAYEAPMASCSQPSTSSSNASNGTG